ncbi:MAG: hypothetical protein D6698_06745 [Gammaproteobacteria bacterium]|nr:MAG: hypothetical protein D6698_06745 [Gammaproteobacteria bacterium]
MGRQSFIDPRTVLARIRDDGHYRWVGLRQANRNQKCDHKGDAPCPRCLNTGFVFTDFLVKAYLWISTPGVEFYSEAGRISTFRVRCVVQHDRPVNKYDMILELAADHDTGIPTQPFSIIRTYVVADSFGIRGREGKVLYWAVYLEERTTQDGKPGPRGTQYNLDTRGPSV